MKVKIIKKNSQSVWYNNLIGKTFKVDKEGTQYGHYKVKNQPIYIQKSDCVIIKDAPSAKEGLSAKVDVARTRKETPLYSGVLKYFPDALLDVARASFAGQQQHNPDKPLGWDRSKSGDELDALSRHLLEAGTIDTDGVRHSTKVAWRALANLQKELERAKESKTTIK